MDYTTKKLTLDNGITYIVIEQLDYDDKTYLYLANKENEEDNRFVEVLDGSVVNIDPEYFDKTIFPLFMKKFHE